MNPTFRDLAKMIDHSLLHPTMTDEQVRAGCELSRKFGVASACVKPYSVPMAAEIFSGSDVLVCAVAGFPHGNNHTGIKIAEAQRAMAEGATEIDVVVNNGKVLGGAWNEVSAEIKAVNDAGRRRRRDPESHLRKRLSSERAHRPPVRNLFGASRRVRQDVNGIRLREAAGRRVQL